MSFHTDPHDIINTNRFISNQDAAAGPLTNRYQDPDFYRQFTRRQTKDLRPNARFRQEDTLTSDPINQLRRMNPDFPKKTTQNPEPILSDAVNDLVSPIYKKYRKTAVMFRSEFRDTTLYPYANNYKLDFDREFNNVYKMKLTRFFLPNDIPPINSTNNMFLWTYASADLYTNIPQTETFIYPFYDMSSMPQQLLTNSGQVYQQYLPENYGTIDILTDMLTTSLNSQIYQTGEQFINSLATDALATQGHQFSISMDMEKNRTFITNRLENIQCLAIQTMPYNPKKYTLTPAFTDIFYYYYDISLLPGTVQDHTIYVPYEKKSNEYPFGDRYSTTTTDAFPVTFGISPSFVVTFEYSYKNVLKGEPIDPVNTFNDITYINIYPVVFKDLPAVGGFTADMINYREFYDYNTLNTNFNTWAGSENVTKTVANFYRFFDSFTIGVKQYVRYAFYICTAQQYRNIYLLQQYDPNHWAILQPTAFDTLILDEGLADSVSPDYIYSYAQAEVPVTGVGFNISDIIARAKNFGHHHRGPLPTAGRATPLALIHKASTGTAAAKYSITNSILPMLGWPKADENDSANMWTATVAFVHQNITPIITKNGDIISNSINGINGLTRSSTAVWAYGDGAPNPLIIAPFGRNVIQAEYRDGKYYMKQNTVQYLRLLVGNYQPDIVSTIMIANNVSTVEERTVDATNTSTQTSINFQNLFCEIPTANIPYNSTLYEPSNIEKIFDEGGLNKISSIIVQLVDQSGELTLPTKNHYFVLEFFEELNILRDTQITTRNNQVWTNSTDRL